MRLTGLGTLRSKLEARKQNRPISVPCVGITFWSSSGSKLRPKRVQLQRVKGWRMPSNTRKVDRTTVFGNPFESIRHAASDAVRSHRLWLTGVLTDEQLHAQYPDLVAKTPHRSAAKSPGFGPPAKGTKSRAGVHAQPCHADLLLKLANENVDHPDKREAPHEAAAAALPPL